MKSQRHIARSGQILECKAEIERMLKNSQTKIIMPALALGVLRQYSAGSRRIFSDGQVRTAYESHGEKAKVFELRSDSVAVVKQQRFRA